MKSNKGITIISLIVYVIALSALIGTISMLQSYFYKNVDIINDSDRATEQDARISAYITDDVNSGKINKSKVAVENNRITIGFKDESIHQYVYENNNVYYIGLDSDGVIEKKITICRGVDNCNFSYANNELKINMRINTHITNKIFQIK